MKKQCSAARRARRHPGMLPNVNNRKSTRGRKIHYQEVLTDDVVVKTIKHNQS